MSERNHEDVIIGANLKRFREVQGITRKELAEVFHISEDGVYRIERGETGLSSSYAYILAHELNCNMNFIYGVTTDPERMEVENAKEQFLSPATIAKRLRIYAKMLEEMTEDEE